MTDDFLSGESGEVSGIRATTRAVLADALADARERATGQPARLRRAAAALPPRRVLVLAIERPDVPNVLPAAIAELARSRHHAEFATTTVGTAGKFENLSRVHRCGSAGVSNTTGRRSRASAAGRSGSSTRRPSVTACG
jgi:hypothetical protein